MKELKMRDLHSSHMIYTPHIHWVRCDERLKTKDEGSTLLTYTGLEHLKIETRLIDERFASVFCQRTTKSSLFSGEQKKAKAESKNCHTTTMWSQKKPIYLVWKTPHMLRLGKSPRRKIVLFIMNR
jgi:hypothetical protein